MLAPPAIDTHSLLGYVHRSAAAENSMRTLRPRPLARLMQVLLLSLLAAVCRAEDDIVLLVATPELDGSVFEQSVILVAPHDSGAMARDVRAVID